MTSLRACKHSWWMTNMLHDFSAMSCHDMDGLTFTRFMASELSYYLTSDTSQKVIAEQYVGLPYEDLGS